MFDFLKIRKIAKRVLICVSVPLTKAEFLDDYLRGTNFTMGLMNKCSGKDSNEVWREYAHVAEMASSNLREIEKRGVEIIYSAGHNVLSKMLEYDVVILIAHNFDNGTSIEFHDKVVTSTEFLRLMPSSFSGILDISACHSASLMNLVKWKSPNCNVIGVASKTSLGLRTLIYKQVFAIMAKNHQLEYTDALSNVLDTLVKIRSESSSLQESQIDGKLYLGEEEKSSVFAPSEALKGEMFLVQVYIHPENQLESVKEDAKKLDEDTQHRKSMSLGRSLTEGDLIEVELNSTGSSESFRVEDSRKTFTWKGGIISTEFAVSVSNECTLSSLIMKVRISVNKNPSVDCLFKVKIVSSVPNETRADIEVRKFEKSAEMHLQQMELLSKLKEYHDNHSNSNPSQLGLCNKCIDIISSSAGLENKVKRVFISSTSDMKEYRDLIKDQIEGCGMYPEMYENWPQGDKYPCDECCRKVMESDIVISLLGPRYGKIVPEFNMSMTEVEYRVALLSGKPVLVFISKDYREELAQVAKDDIESARRQSEFIREVTSARLIDFYKDDFDLSLLSRTGLLMVIKDMEHSSKLN